MCNRKVFKAKVATRAKTSSSNMEGCMRLPLLGGDSLAFQDKADGDGIIEVELNDPSDELLCNFFLNKEQALQVISQLKKAFEL
jgi:hypothetical protein